MAETKALLNAGFPLGATVLWNGRPAFISLRFGAINGTVEGDRIEIRFDRDPGDTAAVVTLAQLGEAARTGHLVLDGERSVRRPEAGDVVCLSEPFRDIIGWQAASDQPWVARMRLHQSWWRAFRLRVPYGYGPTPGSRRKYGNMLDDAGAQRGLNFLSADVASAYTARLEDGSHGIDPWRTARNLLASQPLAFNLFGHLSRHPQIAAELFDSILGDVAEVTGGEIERNSGALGDRTSFDAFFTFRRRDGRAGSVAIETKLTEPFSQKAYRWHYYLNHPAFSPAIWNTEDVSMLGDLRWSQLWRNHLLAVAEARQNSTLGEPTTLVVHHRLDPHCAANVEGYRALLHDPASCQAITLDQIVDRIRPLVTGNEHHEDWLDRFEDRYLRLEHSEPLVALPGQYCQDTISE